MGEADVTRVDAGGTADGEAMDTGGADVVPEAGCDGAASIVCAGECVDSASDPSHCGSCGALLRIDAERIEPATGDVSLWSRAPTPTFQELDGRKLSVPQGPRSGVSAIWGQWPGDETDEEFNDALSHLS
jgi:hypothetical protein